MIDTSVESLDLAALGFLHVEAAACRRPPYHPKVLFKIYLYGYFNISEEKIDKRIEHHQNRFDEYAAALNLADRRIRTCRQGTVGT